MQQLIFLLFYIKGNETISCIKEVLILNNFRNHTYNMF